MANYLPSEATREKQILAFHLRAKIFRAAEEVTSAREANDMEWERAAVGRLSFAVRTYQNRNRPAVQHTPTQSEKS